MRLENENFKRSMYQDYKMNMTLFGKSILSYKDWLNEINKTTLKI